MLEAILCTSENASGRGTGYKGNFFQFYMQKCYPLGLEVMQTILHITTVYRASCI